MMEAIFALSWHGAGSAWAVHERGRQAGLPYISGFLEEAAMQTIESAAPRCELRAFVRAYAQRRVTDCGVDVLQPVPASLEQVLEFEFGDQPIVEYLQGAREAVPRIAVVGPHTFPPAQLRLRGTVESFAIFFQPLGLWQLFGVPVSVLADRAFEGVDLLGPGMRQLWNRLGECRGFEERVGIAERYLIMRAASPSRCTPIMSAALCMFRNGGGIRIDELANQAALGVRQFERRFMNEMGFAPKLFARITRFQMALDAKITSPGRSWLDVAHQFGYHDQMHMITDFRKLSGANPNAILELLGDMRPSALAASDAGV